MRGSVLFLVCGLSFFGVSSASAQVAVQLPTIESFGFDSTVLVPDGGSMFLGGVSRAAAGRTSRSVPFLGGIPGVGRAFRNQGIGRDLSSSTGRVHVQIISLREMEKRILAEGRRRLQARSTVDPAIEKKAEFLSRNIGRTKRR